MYNLVLFNVGNKYVASVFDMRDNEIWSEKDDMFGIADKLMKNHFKFNSVIINNPYCMVLVTHLHKCEVLQNEQLYNVKDYEFDAPIANESRFGYGFNRYAHRNFLRSKFVKSLV